VCSGLLLEKSFPKVLGVAMPSNGRRKRLLKNILKEMAGNYVFYATDDIFEDY